MVRYADGLLILCEPGQGPGLKTRLKRRLETRKLKLNAEKARLVDTRGEGIEFLGFPVAWRQGPGSRRWYPHAEPGAKSQARMRDKVRQAPEVRTRNQAAVAVVRKVNRITRGWATAFHYGRSTHVFGKQQTFAQSAEAVAVAKVQPHPQAPRVLHRREIGRPMQAVALASEGGMEAMNSAATKPKEPGLGKPCAGKPHAPFDEGEGRKGG